VLKPEKEAEARAIFTKWGLDFAVVGKTTDTLRFVIKHGGTVKADLPIKELGDQAPEYDRPWTKPVARPVLKASDITPVMDNRAALLGLIGSPDFCSKRWVWEQYDSIIGGNTLQRPGGDAAVVRIKDGPKGLALTVDVTPRYVEADPFEGGKQAVAETYRNITASGGLPIAITDNLNFGNPERPEIMGQLVMAIRGIGEACKALDYPVVSGNVSLYNETNGKAILPTPSIGGVGLLADVNKHMTIGFKREGEHILLVGKTSGWLGASAYLETLMGREEGAPPPVDLKAEKANGDFVRALILAGRVSAVHDCSDGGLAVALAEMAMAGKMGCMVQEMAQDIEQTILAHAFLFGEDQARYVITASEAEAGKILREAAKSNIPASFLGVTSGQTLTLPGEIPISLEDLSSAHEGWLPNYMR
jgi:phosphoribosylformylglycinamidine synthase subunit PurL